MNENRGRTLMQRWPATTKWLIFITVLSTVDLVHALLTH